MSNNFNTLTGEKPLIIAHRGASGVRPEHTLEAYELAIEQGADFVEPDLVITKDGVLIARHEPYLDNTSNVADVFGEDRKATKMVDGQEITGYFAEDFTLAEIKTLKARQVVASFPERSQEFDDLFEIPTLDEIIDLVQQVEAETGKKVGIIPETKQPTFLALQGLSPEEPLVQTFLDQGFTDTNRIYFQSFEVANLIKLHDELLPGTALEGTPLVQLFSRFERQPYDIIHNFAQPNFDPIEVYGTDAIKADTTYGDLINQDNNPDVNLLKDFVADYAGAIGPWKRSFVLTEPLNPDQQSGAVTVRLTGEVLPVIEDAHEAGLQVTPYTFRNEESSLALEPDGTIQTPIEELHQQFELGADGVFVDFPDTGVEALNSFNTGTFTLQLLHASDQEAGVPALTDIIGFSAVMNALQDDYANTIKLTSGDIYISSPLYAASSDIYDRASTGEPAGLPGVADILIQNELGWDAATVGNHEFSSGEAGFLNLVAPDPDIVNGAGGGVGIGEGGYAGTSFPYLATNLDYSNSLLPAGLEVVAGAQAPKGNSLTTSVIVDVNGESIGVIGVVTPHLPAIADIGNIQMTSGDNIGASSPFQIQVDAVIEGVKQEVADLEAKGVNKIIVGTHLQQFEIEKMLAQELVNQNIGVDILIGGGSHRVMANADFPIRQDETQTPPQLLQPYPEKLTNSDNTNTLYLLNTGANYRYISRLVANFDENGVITSIDATDSQAYATDTPGVDRLYAENITTSEQVRAKADPDIVGIVDGLSNNLNQQDANIFGQTDVFLNGIRGDARTQETNLGNLISDAQIYYGQQYLNKYGDQLLEGVEKIQISFKNGGGIRDYIGTSTILDEVGELVQLPPAANPEVGKEEGDVSQLDISNSLRFDRDLVAGTVTAAGIYELAEHMVSALPTINGLFGQVGGFKFSFDPTAKARTPETPGERIQNLVLINEKGEGTEVIVKNGQLVGDPNRTFGVVANSVLANGGDSYPDVITNQVRLDSLPQPDSLNQAQLTPGAEQDALAEYLAAFYNNDKGQTPYSQADTPQSGDTRIQNLNFREDTVLDGIQPPLPTLVNGTPGNDFFDAALPDANRFAGDNQILNTGSGNDTVDVRDAVGGNNIRTAAGNDTVYAGTNNRIDTGAGDDILFLGSAGGNNIVTGGAGKDNFWITEDDALLPANPNTIADYKANQGDLIGFFDTSLSFGSRGTDWDYRQAGANTIIEAFGQDVAILNGVNASTLTQANFVFA